MTRSRPSTNGHDNQAAAELMSAAAGSAPGESPGGAGEAGGGETGAASTGSETAGGASDELKAIVEALIYASPDPLPIKALQKLIDGESGERIAAAIASLDAGYQASGRGLQLVEVAGGYQIVTRPELHEWVRRLFHERTTAKLSVQALETLAVIAYKQPITAAEIGEIRGVHAAGVLGTLIDRRLIRIAGRKPVVGRPFMYATTGEFLDRFGLKDLSELPRIEDMADALGFEPAALHQSETLAPSLPFEGDAPSGRSEGG
jgi:segregation and condensation protein B